MSEAIAYHARTTSERIPSHLKADASPFQLLHGEYCGWMQRSVTKVADPKPPPTMLFNAD